MSHSPSPRLHRAVNTVSSSAAIPGGRSSSSRSPAARPACSLGWPPASHEDKVGRESSEGYGPAEGSPRQIGPGQVRGRIKDLLRWGIEATPNHGRTRDRIASLAGTTGGEIKKKGESNDSRHLGAHELEAVTAVLGPAILEEVADRCGYLLIPKEQVEDLDEVSLCELLLEAQDASGALAHQLREARRSLSPGGESITDEERDAIQRAGRATLVAFQRLMMAVGGSR